MQQSHNKQKIVVIQPLLPKYSIEFFNEIQKRNKYDLYLFADIETKNQLNQVTDNVCLFNIKHINIAKMGPFVFSNDLNKHISKILPNVIIYNGNPRDLGQLYSLITMNRKFKTIEWSMFHRIGGPRVYSTIFYKLISKIADRTMTYSKIGKYFQIARGSNPTKVHILSTAINEKKVIEEKEKVTGSMKKQFRVEQNLGSKKILLQVVRLSAIKKPEFLINTIYELSKNRDDFTLILIGGGDLEEKMKKKVKKSNLDSYVKFIGPLYDEEKLALWFSIADVFIMTTCIGLSAHHAMCYGLPIITDNSQHNQASEFDILSDGLNCLLYDEGNKESFVQKISVLLDDKDLQKYLSNNAFHTVSKIYTLENKVNNFINITNILLEDKK